MYSLFFPVFKKSTKREDEVLKPIEDYVLPRIPPETITAKNVASLLAYLIDFNLLHGRHSTYSGSTLKNVTSSFLLHLTAKYLRTSEARLESLQQIDNLINSFAYEPFKQPFFGYSSFLHLYDNRYKLFCVQERTLFVSESPARFSIRALCSGNLALRNGTIKLSDDCKWYCHAIVNSRETQELVRSFYALALDMKGPLVPGYPENLLPVCRFHANEEVLKDGCWKRIVTDKGICFSSVTGVNKHQFNIWLFRWHKTINSLFV